MELPSKELLSEIFGIKHIYDIEIYNNTLKINSFALYDTYPAIAINIYELMHKMKEYVKAKGCYIHSGLHCNSKPDNIMAEVFNGTTAIHFQNSQNAATEFEAVTKAAQYIYDRNKR